LRKPDAPLPGEGERNLREPNRAVGIALPQATLARSRQLAATLGGP